MNGRIAVLMCVYSGDDECFFVDAVKSIISNSSEKINIYVHIDGEISESLYSFIKESSMIYKYVESKNNIGLAKGLNKLITFLESESLIFRMDADDIVINNRFDVQINFMDNNPNIDICGGNILEFEKSIENITYKRSYPEKNSDIVHNLSFCSPLAHVTVCFRKSVFDKYGLYPVDHPLNEDIAYWFKLAKSGAKFANIQKYLVAVRMDGAYQRRTLKKAWPELKVYLSICTWQKKLPIKPILRFIFRLCPPKVVSLIYKSKLRSNILKS